MLFHTTKPYVHMATTANCKLGIAGVKDFEGSGNRTGGLRYEDARWGKVRPDVPEVIHCLICVIGLTWQNHAIAKGLEECCACTLFRIGDYQRTSGRTDRGTHDRWAVPARRCKTSEAHSHEKSKLHCIYQLSAIHFLAETRARIPSAESISHTSKGISRILIAMLNFAAFTLHYLDFLLLSHNFRLLFKCSAK
jgi:hypothetical protein